MIINLFWLGSKPVAANLTTPPWDKVAHIVTYLVICLLLWFVAGLKRRFDVIVIVACVAAVDEVRQQWLPGRTADWYDLAANAAALVIFCLIAMFYQRHANAMSIEPSSTRSD